MGRDFSEGIFCVGSGCGLGLVVVLVDKGLRSVWLTREL